MITPGADGQPGPFLARNLNWEQSMKRPGPRSTPAGEHRPVLLDEVLAVLDPQPGHTVVDCTVGWAGHGYVGSIDPATKQIQLYTAGFQEGARPIRGIISPDHTTLWFLTYGADPLRGLLYGVGKFDIASKRVTEYRYGFNASIPHEPSDLTYGPGTASAVPFFVD